MCTFSGVAVVFLDFFFGGACLDLGAVSAGVLVV